MQPHVKRLDIAEMVVGRDVAVFAGHYICKEPGIGRAIEGLTAGALK